MTPVLEFFVGLSGEIVEISIAPNPDPAAQRERGKEVKEKSGKFWPDGNRSAGS
jgi:hypothetical protein